jgi:hypothetical protein
MYSTEHAFSVAFCSKLKKAGMLVTRIESHGTGNGIPDMFVVGTGWDCWVELKNMPDKSIYSKVLTVPWRPGQVAWMFQYFNTIRIRSCLTIVACCDGVIIIPMIHTFKERKVYNPTGITWKDWSKINVRRVIQAMSAYIRGTNYLDAVNKLCGMFYTGMDYDPECLWNPDLLDKQCDYKIFNSQKLDVIMTMEFTAMNNKEA